MEKKMMINEPVNKELTSENLSSVGSMKSKKVEKKRREVLRSDVELINRGIRPENMPQEVFRRLRAQNNKMDRAYLKGRFMYVSKEIVEITDELTGKKQKIAKTYPVYRRTQPKVLGRAGKAR